METIFEENNDLIKAFKAQAHANRITPDKYGLILANRPNKKLKGYQKLNNKSKK